MLIKLQSLLTKNANGILKNYIIGNIFLSAHVLLINCVPLLILSIINIIQKFENIFYFSLME